MPGEGGTRSFCPTSSQTKEREELEAQEEVEAYHTRREGPHVQREDRERCSTTMPEASPLSNPAEFRTEEDTVGEGRQDVGRTKAWKGLTEVVTRGSRPQGTDGGIFPRKVGAPPNLEPSASKLSQGGAEKGRDCCQDTGGTKIWKNLARSFLRGSHRQPKTGASVQLEQGGSSQEEEATRAPGRPRPGGALRSA